MRTRALYDYDLRKVLRPYMEPAPVVIPERVTEETRKNLEAILQHFKPKGGVHNNE